MRSGDHRADPRSCGLRVVKACDRPAGGCRTRDEVKAGDPTVLLVMEHTFTRGGHDANY
jgi:hypothetical protein